MKNIILTLSVLFTWSVYATTPQYLKNQYSHSKRIIEKRIEEVRHKLSVVRGKVAHFETSQPDNQQAYLLSEITNHLNALEDQMSQHSHTDENAWSHTSSQYLAVLEEYELSLSYHLQ